MRSGAKPGAGPLRLRRGEIAPGASLPRRGRAPGCGQRPPGSFAGARSSGGQSAALIRPRPLVRVQARPPGSYPRGAPARHGAVAQPGERRFCKAEVRGSNPRGSTAGGVPSVPSLHLDNTIRGVALDPAAAGDAGANALPRAHHIHVFSMTPRHRKAEHRRRRGVGTRHREAAARRPAGVARFRLEMERMGGESGAMALGRAPVRLPATNGGASRRRPRDGHKDGRMVDALALRADEGRGHAAKTPPGRRWQPVIGDVRMGQPARRYGRAPR